MPVVLQFQPTRVHCSLILPPGFSLGFSVSLGLPNGFTVYQYFELPNTLKLKEVRQPDVRYASGSSD
jgi:hypothetical protein